ncbi:MAG: hypothetical protein KKC75_01745 [Nanoarchaeota archaeon]|nr:hypothetical protein [Nanoarchaeota archaeon]MBU1005384.1 hypothetical protein [Nanoarchaeota archaeon]MBU1945573.1 hypothetical protein [Nanoarchaeota archaeon]
MGYIFGPTWFYGIDYIFDFVSVIVGLLIAYFSYRIYKYTSQKKYIYFSASFFLVALSFVCKILATIPVYSKELKVETVGLVTVTSEIIKKVGWVSQFGISIARLVTIFAFLLLVLVALKIKDKKIIVLLGYLLIISTTLVSASYTVFHLTLLIMMSILFLNYRHNYKKMKSFNSKMVMSSFFVLAISQVFFIFEGVAQQFYVVGESIQLIGYLVLLFAMIKMLIKK